MMQDSDFNSVEAELREVDEEFASGRMNAFGTAATQESFIRELKRIADVETQIFYRTCAIIKSSTEEDHSMLTKVFAGATQPEGSQTRGTADPSSGMSGAASMSSATGMNNTSMSMDDPTAFPRAGMAVPGDAGSSVPMMNPSSSYAQSSRAGESEGVAPPISNAQWSNTGNLSDRAFDDLARHFKMLEGDFASVSENLKSISRHVMLLNEMSERVNANATGNPSTKR